MAFFLRRQTHRQTLRPYKFMKWCDSSGKLFGFCFSRLLNRFFLSLSAAVFVVVFVAANLYAAPVTSHPRLWVSSGDLTRLRSWAVDSNPLYKDGLALLAAQAKADMDAGLVPGSDADNGGTTYVSYPAEQYAEIFAFMSLISSDQATRDDYAQRARTLLMYVINKAVLGLADGQPYRDPGSPTSSVGTR